MGTHMALMNKHRSQVRRLRVRSCLLCPALKPSLLRLLTAHDAVGARWGWCVRRWRKHRKVGGFDLGVQSQVQRLSYFVAAV